MTEQRPCRQFWRILILATLVAGIPLGSAQGQSQKRPRFDYARLQAPSDDVLTTGSLPSASALGGRSPGFSALVHTGNILVRDTAPTRCLPDQLTRVVADLAARFGPLSVESTHRSRGRNRRAGGARHSLHLSCRAIDFRVHAPIRAVMAYLRSRPEVGGLKVYRSGIIHIDNGDRRSW